jgi:triosephosphate isomerase
MKPIIVANWKMNPQTLQEAKELFNRVAEGIKNACPEFHRRVEVVICPPFVYIQTFKHLNILTIKLGAQSCFWEEKGAYTGEVSPKMLKDLGCEYVILGHSERRKNLGETDEMINKKIKAALKEDLKPILCVGETGEQREEEITEKILEKQTAAALEGLSEEQIGKVVLAYEPIWAIGTGNACDIDRARKVELFLEKILKIPVLYGGSVDSENALGYIKEAGFDGLLVGGASLIPEEFIKIAKSI